MSLDSCRKYTLAACHAIMLAYTVLYMGYFNSPLCVCRVPAGLLKDASHDSYKQGLEDLRSRYYKGLDFIVFTPVYLTLRQQTLQRLKDAGLKNSDGTEPRVLCYKFSTETTVHFQTGLSSQLHSFLAWQLMCIQHAVRHATSDQPY